MTASAEVREQLVLVERDVLAKDQHEDAFTRIDASALGIGVFSAVHQVSAVDNLEQRFDDDGVRAARDGNGKFSGQILQWWRVLFRALPAATTEAGHGHLVQASVRFGLVRSGDAAHGAHRLMRRLSMSPKSATSDTRMISDFGTVGERATIATANSGASGGRVVRPNQADILKHRLFTR